MRVGLQNNCVLEWSATDDGAVAIERDDYTPRFHVASRSSTADIDLTVLRTLYERHPDVVVTEVVSLRPGFRRDDERVLAVDVDDIDRITSLARQARQLSVYCQRIQSTISLGLTVVANTVSLFRVEDETDVRFR